jgi:hypothetical protein
MQATEFEGFSCSTVWTMQLLRQITVEQCRFPERCIPFQRMSITEYLQTSHFETKSMPSRAKSQCMHMRFQVKIGFNQNQDRFGEGILANCVESSFLWVVLPDQRGPTSCRPRNHSCSTGCTGGAAGRWRPD